MQQADANPVQILELSCSAAAGYAGALLAQLGFPVERLACMGGYGATGDSGGASVGGEVFLHHQKTQLDPVQPRRATHLSIELSHYRVLVEDIGRSGLKALGWSYRSLRAAHPGLIIVSLSPFGLRGAYADWLGSDLLAQAVGGVMHTVGYQGEAPRMLPGEAAFMIAGLHGATAAVTAVFDPTSDDAGLHIDIAAQETFMQHWTRHVSEYAYSGVLMQRSPRDPEGLHYRHTAQASDGWVYLLALREPWQDLAAFLGLGEHIDADAFAPGAPQPPWQTLEAEFHAAVASKGKYEWFAEAAELGWTFAPVEDPFAIAASEQTAARGGFPDTDCNSSADGSGPVTLPPLPWTVD